MFGDRPIDDLNDLRVRCHRHFVTVVEDGRKKILAEVARRQGQSSFRADLLEAYEGKCAISGTGVADVLQAAHTDANATAGPVFIQEYAA